MAFAKYYRWSDNDYRAGPFLYAYSATYRPFGVVLDSGNGREPEYEAGCTLRLSAFGHTLIFAMPAIIKPWRKWVDCSKYEWSTSELKGYWDSHAREYGFSLSRSGAVGDPLFLQVFLGRQTDDSSTEQRWSKFLPWTEWRHVRRSLYDASGAHFATMPEGRLLSTWDREREIEDSCPTCAFEFKDFDGEVLTAVTRIEEREWRFGRGWFTWLSVFRAPKVHRYLDLHFSGETGKRKGSWKGGTIGHSIEMRPGEMHRDAFVRYCAEHSMTFVGSK